MTLEQLVTHYIKHELPRKTYSTQVSYKDYLRLHIVPKWGDLPLGAVKAVEVEQWLAGIQTAKGTPASPNSKTKIRNVMCGLFSHAVRYEFAAKNPITSVRTSAKRLRVPDILTGGEFQGLMQRLELRERVMVFLAGTTGLRRGELIALRWETLTFSSSTQTSPSLSGETCRAIAKTEASRKPVPLHPLVIQALMEWRAVSPYKGEQDFLFPSVAKNGSQPL